MTELSSEEEHWLVVFAKYNPFFDDLLKYYLKNDSLSEKQYESLEKEIEKADTDATDADKSEQEEFDTKEKVEKLESDLKD